LTDGGHCREAYLSQQVDQRPVRQLLCGMNAVASYVAASRVQMKRHYLSDVAFGAALGIVAGRTVTIGRGNARSGLAPMASPGGGGVAFNWMAKQ
jgi:hypothetical protein